MASARGYVDQLAERAAALGVSPDGRAGTIASASSVTQLADGWVQDHDVVAHFVGLYGGGSGEAVLDAAGAAVARQSTVNLLARQPYGDGCR